MHIRMICPAPPNSLYGNRVTALRWSRILRRLGHRVTIAQAYDGEYCDLLIALHASKSSEAALDFRRHHPDRPLIVALTGTDLYRDIARSPQARQALQDADRLVALQRFAIRNLPAEAAAKVRVIYQSVDPIPRPPRPDPDAFVVSVVGHLRDVKDPLRAACASRLLPASSRIRLLQAGASMDDSFCAKARAEQDRNPRYRWLGPLPRAKARRLIASSRVMVLSSRMEGGANVISEAAVEGVPVLASRIDGSIGLLGEDYPAYFPVGDTEALAALLHKAETDPAFYRDLKHRIARLARLFRPSREQNAWRKLLRELQPSRISSKRPSARK